MKVISLLLRVLAILGAVVAIVGWVLTKGKVEEANQQIVKIQAEASAARQEASDSEQKFKASDSRAKALESDLADAKSRATSARSQLAEAQRDISGLRSDVREKDTEIQAMEAQNTKLKEEIISMRTEVPDVDPTKLAEYEEKISSLNSEIDRLKDELSKAPRTGSAPVAVASTEPSADGSLAPTAAPRLAPSDDNTAAVLKADVKSGLVIIDRGQKAGLQEQMEFGIAKGYSKPVRVKVAKVAPDYSLAYILPGSEGAKFAAGDEIKLLQ